MIAALEKELTEHPERVALARTAADVRLLERQGRLAAILGPWKLDTPVVDEHGVVRELAQRGVRFMSPTWNEASAWADSSYEELHGGLTPFGRAVVREMNRLGMIVDVSHVSDATFEDVLETSVAPIIASHSSCRALVDHPRNLTDAMLRRIAENGGVAMINFQDVFIDPRKKPPWRALRFAITHLAQGIALGRDPPSRRRCDGGDVVFRFVAGGRTARSTGWPIHEPRSPSRDGSHDRKLRPQRRPVWGGALRDRRRAGRHVRLPLPGVPEAVRLGLRHPGHRGERDLRLLRGRPRCWSRPTGGGSTLRCYFCPEGGSRVRHGDPEREATASVEGGSLDVPVDLHGAVYIRTRRELPGLVIPAGARQLPAEPP